MYYVFICQSENHDIMLHSSPTIKTVHLIEALRDWSLITRRGGGGYITRGEHVKFYPYEKGGRKRFSHAEEGAQKVWGSFYAVA